MSADVLLAWLGTYAIHSTLLLGAAWLLTRALARREPDDARSMARRERIWRAAVVAGLVSATLQTGLRIRPLGGALELRPAAASAPLASVASPTDAPLVAPRGVAAPGAPPAAPRVAELRASAPGAARGVWRSLLFSGWLLGIAVGAVALGLLVLRLRGALRGRRALVDGPARAALDALASEARLRRPVGLAIAPRLNVPISHGVLRPEICLPEPALTTLDPRELRALLAHELAHVVRRDAAWSWILRGLSTVLFFQPLHRVARRELEDTAEFLCDHWAAARTGDGLDLARCLTRVAGWLVEGAPPLPAPAMARSRARLSRRVEHLLAARPARLPDGRRAALLAVACIVAAAFAAPGVARRAARAGDPGPFLPDAAAAPVALHADGGAATEHGGSLDAELAALLVQFDRELTQLDEELQQLEREARELDCVELVAPRMTTLRGFQRGLHEQRRRLADWLDASPRSTFTSLSTEDFR